MQHQDLTTASSRFLWQRPLSFITSTPNTTAATTENNPNINNINLTKLVPEAHFYQDQEEEDDEDHDQEGEEGEEEAFGHNQDKDNNNFVLTGAKTVDYRSVPGQEEEFSDHHLLEEGQLEAHEEIEIETTRTSATNSPPNDNSLIDSKNKSNLSFASSLSPSSSSSFSASAPSSPAYPSPSSFSLSSASRLNFGQQPLDLKLGSPTTTPSSTAATNHNIKRNKSRANKHTVNQPEKLVQANNNNNNNNHHHSNSKSNSNNNSSMGKQRRLYRCRHCGFETEKKVENWQHIRIHMRPEKLLACESCQFVTEYKHHLEYHQRNHSGFKPFKCHNCDYQCVNKSMLNSHMKSHSSVYQYKCGDCKYATKYVHSLKMHLRKYNHKPQLMIDVYGRKRGPKSNSSSSSSSHQDQQEHNQQQQQCILDLRVDSKLDQK